MNRDDFVYYAAGAAMVIGIVLGVVLLIGGIVWITNSLALPGSVAKIEQLRLDVRRVNVANAEDVVGQVTEWNQKIRSNQAFNREWYSGWLIPDEWDSIEPIEVSVTSVP